MGGEGIRPSGPRKILFIQTAFLGDVVFSTALLRGVRKLYGDAELTLLASPRGGGILDGDRDVNRIILYDKTGKERGPGHLAGLIRRIRHERFDLVVSPHRSFRSGLIARLSGAPRRLGFTSGAGAFAYNAGTPFPAREKRSYRRELSLLRCLSGGDTAVAGPRLNVTEAAMREAAGYLGGAGGEIPAVGLVPGTVWATKRWPLEKYLELGRKLARTGEARPVVIGGPGEREEASVFTEEEGFVNLTGLTPLRLLPALLASCRAVVAADTGPLHAAMAVGTPVVALFGPTDEEQFEFGRGDSCLTVGLDCRPCSAHGSSRCPEGNWRCLPGIAVEDVASALRKIPGGTRAGGA